jgi:hypothetical protein
MSNTKIVVRMVVLLVQVALAVAVLYGGIMLAWAFLG